MIFHVQKRWRQKWNCGKHIGKNCFPDNISSTLKCIPFNGFNSIKVSLRILGTSLVTTCTCEQSFSALRYLKTYTRSTMVSERINGIVLMHVHEKIYPDLQKSIDHLKII